MNIKQVHLFILTVLMLLLLGGYIVMVAAFHVPKDEQILTALIALATMSFGFWFNSTAGSQKKDETIATMAGNPPPAAPVPPAP